MQQIKAVYATVVQIRECISNAIREIRLDRATHVEEGQLSYARLSDEDAAFLDKALDDLLPHKDKVHEAVAYRGVGVEFVVECPPVNLIRQRVGYIVEVGVDGWFYCTTLAEARCFIRGIKLGCLGLSAIMPSDEFTREQKEALESGVLIGYTDTLFKGGKK